jgi:hypothetical protein
LIINYLKTELVFMGTSQDGKVVRSFSPRTSINSEELTQAIKALL